MDNLFILAKVEEYFEEEFKSLNEGLDKYDWMQKNAEHYIEQTMNSMCSIVMFAQKLGVDFDSLNSIYEDKYYNVLWEMRHKAHNPKSLGKIELTF